MDDFSYKILHIIREKVSRDTLAFTNKLLGLYTQVNSPQKKLVSEAKTLATKAMSKIEAIMASGDIGKSDAPQLFEVARNLNNKIYELQGEVGGGKFEKTLQGMGLDINDVLVNMDSLRTAIAEARKSGLKQKISDAIPDDIKAFGAEAASSVMTAILGPAAPLGNLILSGAKGIASSISSSRTRSKQGGLVKSLYPNITSAETEGVIGERSKGRGFAQDFAGSWGRGSVGGQPMTAKDSYSFWDKGAYNAKYTKELLKAIKSGGSGAKSSAGGEDGGVDLSVGGITGMMSKMLPAVLAALPTILTVAGIAVAGAAALYFAKKDFEIAKDIGKLGTGIYKGIQKNKETDKANATAGQKRVDASTEQLKASGVNVQDIIEGKADISKMSQEDLAAANEYMKGKRQSGIAGRDEYVRSKSHVWSSAATKDKLRQEYDAKNVEPYRQKMQEIQAQMKQNEAAAGETGGESSKHLEKQTELLQQVNKNLEKMGNTQPQQSGMPNVNYSGDALLDKITNGSLSLTE